MNIIYKIAILFFASSLIIGCDSKTNLEVDGNVNNVVYNFLSEVKSLESDTNINPIIAFKELAEEISDTKMVVSKKNIKKVLIKSKKYSNCVIITGNHTIIKIISFDNCQPSGSWEACMPLVEGYIKKGKLNYKKDFMNNVIGAPDKQERVAYFFNKDEIKSKIKAHSFEKTSYSSYYKNGNIKLTGHGFVNFDKYFVFAKDGLDLLEGAEEGSNKLVKIPYNTQFWLDPNFVLHPDYVGKWLNIIGDFYLPEDEIEPTYLEGYIFVPSYKDIEIKADSIKKPGIWTYYYKSGVIEREEFHYGGLIKEISYDKDGDITAVSENNCATLSLSTGYSSFDDGLWGKGIAISFHKNGNIKSISKGEDFDAVQVTFDENRNIIGNGYGLHYEMILSKDIRNLYLNNSTDIFKEINKFKISEDNALGKIENTAREENIIFEEETSSESPENSSNYFICYNENDNKNLKIWIGFNEKSNASKVKYKGMNLEMDLVFVKELNENPDGPYPVLVEYYNEIYQEKVNGIYKLTKSGNWYYAVYTRASDNKQFSFTIDNESNNFGKTPCF
jgi:hypothetical protein